MPHTCSSSFGGPRVAAQFMRRVAAASNLSALACPQMPYVSDICCQVSRGRAKRFPPASSFPGVLLRPHVRYVRRTGKTAGGRQEPADISLR